ncbi:MAG: extracellular solute-binding protein [Spirochaetia bacterium]
MRAAACVRRAVLAAVFGCLVSGAGAGAQGFTSKAVDADEKAMAAEKRPTFSCPTVEDKALSVSGLPEKLAWYTSRPGVFGSPRARQGGTFRGYIAEFPDTFRTVGPNANGAYRPYFTTSPNLVDNNGETKEWMPALATDWAFGADGKSVYFKLNEKARWTDGTPVTSADYTFMFSMMRSPNIQDPWYNEYYTKQVVDVKAFGDWVIRIQAGVPMARDDLLYNVDLAPRPARFYGGEIRKDWVDAYQWTFEPTAGPYYLDSFKKGESLTFRKVKDWWGYQYDYNRYRFNVDTLEFRVITGGNDIVRNYFYNGEIDSYPLIVPQEWADAETHEPVKKGYIDRQYDFYVPLTGVSGIILNVRDPFFTDVRVRRGLYYAINIQKMIDTTLRGEYSRYHNIGLAHVFAGRTFDDDTIRKPSFDPGKAGELFDAAGYSAFGPDGIRRNSRGDRLSFELLYQSPNHTERLSVLKEEAKKAGVEIQLKLMQQGSFTAVREKKFQAWWGGMSTSLYDDYWEYFHSVNADKTQTNNFWGYADKNMDKLLDAFRSASDLAKKAALDRQIQRKVDEAALVIPNYYVPYWRGAAWKWIRFPAWLSQKYFDDFYDPLSGTTGYTGYFWIDGDIRKEVIDAQRSGRAYAPRVIRDETYRR